MHEAGKHTFIFLSSVLKPPCNFPCFPDAAAWMLGGCCLLLKLHYLAVAVLAGHAGHEGTMGFRGILVLKLSLLFHTRMNVLIQKNYTRIYFHFTCVLQLHVERQAHTVDHDVCCCGQRCCPVRANRQCMEVLTRATPGIGVYSHTFHNSGVCHVLQEHVSRWPCQTQIDELSLKIELKNRRQTKNLTSPWNITDDFFFHEETGEGPNKKIEKKKRFRIITTNNVNTHEKLLNMKMNSRKSWKVWISM